MRTLAVLVALLLAGIALARLTAPAPVKITTPPPKENPSAAGEIPSATFELLLSGTAKRVSLSAGGDPADFQDTVGPMAGKLQLGSDKPTIFLEVDWADAPAGHRFAKLRLEIPGKETREHVFSSAADIDDIWEP